MIAPQLIIVIHAEEEFDWNSGFYRSNTKVTHFDELITLVDKLINRGSKVTFAMDYPFVNSDGGSKVIEKYKAVHGEDIEFASHLHPWVNPPFENSDDEVDELNSYPCNLGGDYEYQKLKSLSDLIEERVGHKPKTYLAGRYGIGENTSKCLKSLGYRTDLSISAYTDFSHQLGPDFTYYPNNEFYERGMRYIPHTCALLANNKYVRRYLAERPHQFYRMKKHPVKSVFMKLMRVRKHRLSPEGFSFEQMKTVTEAQMELGQKIFVLSFHSPSVKAGLTPYVKDEAQRQQFNQSLLSYVDWFSGIDGSRFVLPNDVVMQEP